MSSEKEESVHLSPDDTGQTNNTNAKSKGCHLTVTTGFILILLAVAIAVGVGLIVHFAHANSKCHCNCGIAASGDNAMPHVCSVLASAAFQPLCSLCPKSSDTTMISLSTTKAPTIIKTTAPPIRDVRLPTSLKPIHYNLRVRPDIYGTDPTFIFSGDIEIFIQCLSETDNITLHMKELELTSYPIVTSDTGSPSYRSHTLDFVRQFLVVHLSGAFTVGQNYTLRLQFRGKLADDLLGFYKTSYTIGLKTVHLAFTTFQPTEARKAFPCFDEPALKATYTINLDRKTDSDIMTLANMPKIRSVQLNDGYTRDTFLKSFPMSSYLVSYAFTNYIGKTDYSAKGTKVRVYTRPDFINMTGLALQLNVELLGTFESYFGIKYSLPKLDSIGAPEFYAGALEQWGLVTYTDYILVYIPGVTTTRVYEYSHIIIAHEVGHQFCGNLVTPAWWDDLWLNEGFANFLAYLGLDRIRPRWKMTELQVVTSFHQAMEKDGLETSHPIHMDVKLPAEIFALFDPITYDKGGAVVRMMSFILGDNTFRYGMQDYLKGKAYDAANHSELYTFLENRARLDGLSINLKTTMNTWVEQMNYPLVNVTFDSDSNEINLHQQRFLYICASNKAKCEQSSFMWEIPFTYATSNRLNFQPTRRDIKWMSKTDRTTKITDNKLPSNSDRWILGNIKQYGFYRVTYSQDNWEALQRQLMKDHTVIHVLNRAQLIDDSWALSKAGMIDVSIPLKMMNYLKKETEYIPWLAAKSDLEIIHAFLEPTKTYGKFLAYIADLVKDQFEANDITNIEGKAVQIRYMSGLMFDLACKYFIQSCEDQAIQLFNDWRDKGKLLPPDVMATVLCTAVREGTEAEWNYMYSIFKTSPANAINALNAMGCSRRHWLQRRLLDYSLREDKIHKAYVLYAIVAVAKNPDGFHQALNFLMINWKFLVTYTDTSTLNQIIGYMTRAMSTDNDIQEVMFWKDHIHPAGAEKIQAFDSAITNININKYWFKHNFQKLDEWLSS